MAIFKISPLSDVMKENDIESLENELGRLGVALREQNDDLDQGIEGEVEDDILSEFMDSLDEEHAAADIYIPGLFSEVLPFGEIRIGSLQSLIEALENLQDELGIDDPDSPPDEDEEDIMDDEDEDIIDDFDGTRAPLKKMWFEFYRAANEALDAESNLIIKA
ncbi:hypothetical protein KKF34_17260 [Myxococcota bacterium]|nr:hypothetical protein [Myxococcota bacterium]MBU1498630.1 hypothetical protein [Myxococcota bacterium]